MLLDKKKSQCVSTLFFFFARNNPIPVNLGPLIVNKTFDSKQQAEIIDPKKMSLANRSKHEQHFDGRRIRSFYSAI
jgi:hypothetical protein